MQTSVIQILSETDTMEEVILKQSRLVQDFLVVGEIYFR